jgi:hypothetical protein
LKLIIQFLYIILITILLSCSHQPERNPAQIDNETFNFAFSFPAMKKGKEKLPTINFMSLLKVEYVAKKSLPNNAAYFVELAVDNKKSDLVFRVYHTKNSFYDKVATESVADFYSNIMTSHGLSQFGFFEAYYNAANGDPNAIDLFLQLRDDFASNKVEDSDSYRLISSEIKLKREELSEDILALKAARVKSSAKRKIKLDELDKAPTEKQFRYLISKGDRKGVATLLKKYLPIEAMPPFERRFWETYISVIQNPVPLEQRILIYRGLSDDYIHRAFVKGRELSEKEAIADGRAFVMSSLMVKNQGSWNRRLRSLETMYKKYIALNMADEQEYTDVSRISAMFGNHAGTPAGSPFLSFTPNIKIADEFAGERLSSYLIDPRLLNFNYSSAFGHESEYLIALTTFPDDLVGITQIPESELVKKQTYLDEKLEERIASVYGEDQKEKVINKIKKNSYNFFKNQYIDGQDIPGIKTKKANILFYKNFLGPKDIAPPMTSQGEMGCKELIKLFWVVK